MKANNQRLKIGAVIFSREVSLEAARRAEYIWNEDKSVDPFAFPIIENREQQY